MYYHSETELLTYVCVFTRIKRERNTNFRLTLTETKLFSIEKRDKDFAENQVCNQISKNADL